MIKDQYIIYSVYRYFACCKLVANFFYFQEKEACCLPSLQASTMVFSIF